MSACRREKNASTRSRETTFSDGCKAASAASALASLFRMSSLVNSTKRCALIALLHQTRRACHDLLAEQAVMVRSWNGNQTTSVINYLSERNDDNYLLVKQNVKIRGI